HAISDGTNENADFINGANHVRNAYLCFNAMNSENIYYCDAIYGSNNCLDCFTVTNCEGCYECVDCTGMYRSFYCQDSTNCREVMFSRNAQGCQSCFGCVGLRNKQYYLFNEEKTKEEYEQFITDLSLLGENVDKFKDKLDGLYQSLPIRFAKQINTENSTGENLTDCKNCQVCFDINGGENLKYCMNLNGGNRNCQDISNFGHNLEWSYQATSAGRNCNHMLFTVMCCYESNDVFYSLNCMAGNKDLFGCVGLKHKQYCVLNKQYNKEEYEKLVARIIEHMQKRAEWGEYFPYSMSPFVYNESAAQEYYPLLKEGAAKLGVEWLDEDFGLKYDGLFYEPKNISSYDPKKNSNAQVELDELLKGIIRCEVSGKPFRLISQEVAFYIEHGLPIPTAHPMVRYEQRFVRRQPRKLWKRRCMCEEGGHGHDSNQCPVEFETTYGPDGPADAQGYGGRRKVYCEECYQKSVI
ncbi:hypothetical protein KJ855_03735, partial [Patescibacteria group bacterium]|nr:hypothetical protein [Patescibacteria group bacterium]